MSDSVRSALTLLTLSAICLLAVMWGWQAATEPLPSEDPPPLCTERTIPAGEKVFTDQVAVSVFNGSTRNGLAGTTLEKLVARGFVAADSDNAPKQVKTVEIWSDEPRNAAVRLVARQFKGAKIVSGPELGRGVNVVVGAAFKDLRKKDVESVTAVADSTFCSPGGS
ncbi:LytR C-terminal domain-containing protein [Nocardioides piscis]|uniref:LytR C-terminal domain-containing protein n=1 Tax=Nocardioides piscis TaxID=2714938 RepID=A0A6G7YD31_9ACTN|nr:LytR C-terminal domain-containing protein [Nocardioides piscis]QIK74680.1 LytR C-terminal domain-containing protein [Nocardioides piscis]